MSQLALTIETDDLISKADNDIITRENLADVVPDDSETSIPYRFYHIIDMAQIILRIAVWIRSLSKATQVDTIDLWKSLSYYPVAENLRKGMNSLDDQGNIQGPNFNLDRAEFLLWLCCLVISRNQDLVDEAYKKVVQLKDFSRSDVQPIIDLLTRSEDSIHKQAAYLGLRFLPLTECNSVGGPYGGIFWSDNHNFIVLAFKGTDTLSFTEWLTDANLERMDARSFLFGEVHEGFYTSLFPDNSYDYSRLKKQCPAARLSNAISMKAAALATLMHTRIFAAPESVGEHVNHRDAIVFGCPFVGDSDFAAGYRHLENQPKNTNKNLWRVIDDNDLVPRAFLGFHVASLGHYLSKYDLFNYVGIGDDVRFYQDGSKPSSERILYGPDPTALVFRNQDFDSPGLWPFFGLSEFGDQTSLERTAKYFEVMEKSRKYWDAKDSIEFAIRAKRRD
ncbi:16390_t:CDS:2 [Acaulospora colombiana]|uniref:16390_t:CDS:1 n=1 Tax=Acaulospora colombiana TaxID=27376 RepID=A0ACA9LFD1_9GLOM|nr:16390_t:CDS:2 [Acaulospora colombiana]